jgi:putative SOS response-associated peptidase YedK
MCGHIAQYRHPLHYTEFLGLNNAALLFDMADQRPGFNLAPGSHPVTIFADAALRRVHWGYRPAWAAQNGLPYTVNARVESASQEPYFQALWEHGRVIVPADGWYEWRLEDGRKQPYYIRLQAEAPMFLAALSNARYGVQTPSETGLVIVTAHPEIGLLDPYDRRPLVLSPSDARTWLDHDQPLSAISALTRASGLAPDHFTWYPVSNAIEKHGADSADLINPQV